MHMRRTLTSSARTECLFTSLPSGHWARSGPGDEWLGKHHGKQRRQHRAPWPHCRSPRAGAETGRQAGRQAHSTFTFSGQGRSLASLGSGRKDNTEPRHWKPKSGSQDWSPAHTEPSTHTVRKHLQAVHTLIHSFSDSSHQEDSETQTAKLPDIH